MKTRQQILDEVDQIIKKDGWMVQAVFPVAGSTHPDFAYTVGLADKGLPELIVFGLEPRQSQPVLNMLARRLVASNGADPAPDRPLDYVIVEGNVMLIEADRTMADKYMFAAYNRNPGYRALQVVWPDENRNLPWQSGYDHHQFDRFQPVLRQPLH